MVEFKLVIADPKTGKSYKKEVKDAEASVLLGKKIKETVELHGMPGYKFVITGGSDHAGFPMRADIQGTERKRIYAKGGAGIKDDRKGEKKKKIVCGNNISPKITQVNLKITSYGPKPLEEKKAEESKE